MLKFTGTIEYFSANKHQTGWTFVLMNKAQSDKLNPGVRQSYRVKGKIDEVPIKQKALLPVSNDRFMITLDAKIRKALGKNVGETVKVQLELDKKPLKMSGDLLVCLKDEPAAGDYFNSLPPSHQRYYSKWIEDAKTEQTKAKRIAMALMALSQKKDFGMMLREAKGERNVR